MKDKTILIIDDDKEMLAVLEEYFSSQGFKVRGFFEPKEALSYLNSLPVGEKISAIVSDICMPDISGIDLLVETQQIDQRIPVIMISAFSAPYYEQDALSNGAYAFITKPFPLSKVASAVTQAIA